MLSNLINKIDHFYKFALYSLAQYESEDDNELYFDIIDAARKIEDPDTIDELLIIAELYKAAIKLGKGYSSVNMAIKNFMREYPDILGDESGENEVETVLNQIITDLRDKAGGAAALKIDDSLETKRQLQTIKLQKEKEIEEEPEETPSAFELGLGEPDDKPTWNPFMEGGGKDVDKPNAGFSSKKIYEPKDWVKLFSNEAARYADDLDPKANPKVLATTTELINVLRQLTQLAQIREDIRKQLLLAPNDDVQSKFDNINKKISELQKSRNKLKLALRNHFMAIDTSKLEKKLSTASGTEKELLEQKIELNKTLQSRDSNRGPEIALRRDLINMIQGTAKSKIYKGWEGGGIPSGKTLDKIKDDIAKAKAARIPIQEAWQEEAKEVAKIKQTIPDPEGKRKNTYDWQAMKLEGYAKHLSQKLLAERKTIKDYILRHLSVDQKNIFDEYLLNISKAATKKDKTALLAAVKSLKMKINEAVHLTPKFVHFIISVRSSKFLYNFRDQILELQKLNIEDKTSLSPSEITAINDAINTGSKLVSFYRNLKIPQLKGGVIETGYVPPTDIIVVLISYLNDILNRGTK